MKIEAKDGRIFKLEGEEPYRRKNGSLTFLRLWSSCCAKCGGVLVVKTPTTVTKLKHSSSFGQKHCRACIDSVEKHTPAEWVRIIQLQVLSEIAAKKAAQ